MAKYSSICVYCGSRVGDDPRYAAAAKTLGAIFAAQNIRLVYGGGRIGLMGLCADAVLAGGGSVLGVIPGHLDAKEIGHRNVDLRIVPNMHLRKKLMFDESDAFAILPGGIGTMDELFEIVTWRQLELHDKPIVIVNIGGYYDPLLTYIDYLVARGFAGPSTRALFRVVDSVETLCAEIAAEPEPQLTPQTMKL